MGRELMDWREDGEKGARSPCCGRAAGLRSRGARRRNSGFDCEPWRKRAGDSARSGLACTSFAPAPAITAGDRLRCPLVQERRRPQSRRLLNFPPSHSHHQHPSTSITNSRHFHNPTSNQIQKPRQTTQITRNGTQGRFRTSKYRKHVFLRDISCASS